MSKIYCYTPFLDLLEDAGVSVERESKPQLADQATTEKTLPEDNQACADSNSVDQK